MGPKADPEAYDTWLRSKVQKAADDPQPSIPHAEVEASFAERRRADLERK